MKKISVLITILAITTSIIAQTSKTMDFGGETRKYLEYVPIIYDSTEAVPVVLCLHGLGDNMNNFFNIGMNLIADTANFIVLTPEALPAPNFGNAWNSGASYAGNILNPTVNDVGFLNALLDTVIAKYNIDTNNIFVTGFSMGGFMTNRLACESNLRFRAAASVSGTIGNSFTCTPAAAIPFCHFHGTNDGTVAFTNNLYGNDAEELVNHWVSNNNCDTIPIIDSLPDIAADGRTVVHYTYKNGDDSTEVEFYKIFNGEHDWMYLPNYDISYTFKIWEFFSKHRIKVSNNAISDNKLNNDLIIYPNPASTFVQVESEKINIEGYAIYDIAGRNLTGTSLKRFIEPIRVDISNLQQGIYFINLKTNKGQIVKKFIKE